jgi:hypothetical protein
MDKTKKGHHQFTFSKKTDMSVEKAKQSAKDAAEKPMGTSKRRATGNTFVQKLYRDEDELNDLKVLAGEGNFDSDVEDKDDDEKKAAQRKRDAKGDRKKDDRKKDGAVKSVALATTKVGKLVSVS